MAGLIMGNLALVADRATFNTVACPRTACNIRTSPFVFVVYCLAAVLASFGEVPFVTYVASNAMAKGIPESSA
uniref:Uncharacterized protein n=1 Tax=Moniliophthora roreri TaxID=221103 RepID=A0A0W0FHU6_MONRR